MLDESEFFQYTLFWNVIGLLSNILSEFEQISLSSIKPIESIKDGIKSDDNKSEKWKISQFVTPHIPDNTNNNSTDVLSDLCSDTSTIYNFNVFIVTFCVWMMRI